MGQAEISPEQAARAAALLLEARGSQQAIPSLPADCQPADAAAGYSIQDAVVAQRGIPTAGYKIGATSDRAQEFLGLDGPFVGRVFEDNVLDSPAEVPSDNFLFRLIEPEFAFRMGRGLPPREADYGEAEVVEAIWVLHPAIEIVTSAYGEAWTKAGGPALIADNGVHGGLVLGPPREDWRDLDLEAHPVALRVNGSQVGAGVGANALGGPLKALTWLANHLRTRGRGLEAGEIVTTGVVTEFVELEAGDVAVADFGHLGVARVHFSP